MHDPSTLTVGGVHTTLRHSVRRVRGDVSCGLQAEFCSDVCEFLRVHVAAVRGEEPQGCKTAFGEERLRHRVARPDLHEATINHGPQWRWNLGLCGVRATAPGPQLEAVRH